MENKDLLTAVIESLPIKGIHPLHMAVLEECCEHIEKSEIDSTDRKAQILAVQTSFLASEAVLKGAIKGLVRASNDAVINLNYRGRTFKIEEGSYFRN